MKLLIYIFIPFLITYIFTIIHKNYLASVDIPNKRSSHEKPTATSGGVGFVLTSLIFSLFDIYKSGINANLLFIICLPLAVVGFIDDKFNLSNKFRFQIQIIVVLIILNISRNFTNSIFIDIFNYGIIFSLLSVIIITFFGTSIINLVNFIDGIDGLLTSTTSIVFLYLGFSQNNLFFVMFGSLISFLIFNWEPAQIFMGDIGSTYIGGLIVAATLSASSFIIFFNILMIISPIILDAGTCILIRLSKGHNIFRAHKLHLYQRLNQNHLRHSLITKIYLISTILMTISAILGNNFIKILSLGLLLSVGLVLDKKYAVPFDLAFENQNTKI